MIGGYVYRGAALPWLRGTYFYRDYCGGWVRSFRYEGGRAADLRDWSADLGRPGSITSFGEDATGELYVTTQEGSVFRLSERAP